MGFGIRYKKTHAQDTGWVRLRGNTPKTLNKQFGQLPEAVFNI